MRVVPWVVPVLVFAAAAPLAAQNSECAAYSGQAGNICNAAVDGTRTFHPLAGLLISGGNPVLGSGGPLGGLGHFSVTARVNAVKVVLPDLNYSGNTNTVAPGDTVFAPAPLVEGAVGLFGGLPGGLLAVDGLLSAQLLPTDQIKNITVDSSATRIGKIALGVGYGARIGIVRESALLPGVALSVMRRGIPTIQYGSISGGDNYTYAVNLRATNLRLTAGKSFSVLSVAAGLGWDHYTGKAHITFTDPTLPISPVESADVKLATSRMLVFADAGLSLSVVKLVGELGYLGGKDQHLTTNFQGFDPKAGKLFGGVGLRLGL